MMRNLTRKAIAGLAVILLLAWAGVQVARAETQVLPKAEAIQEPGSKTIEVGSQEFVITYGDLKKELSTASESRVQFFALRKLKAGQTVKEAIQKQSAPAYIAVNYSWRSDRRDSAMVQKHRLFEWNSRIYLEVLTELNGERAISYFRYSDQTDVFHWYDHTDANSRELQDFRSEIFEPRQNEIMHLSSR